MKHSTGFLHGVSGSFRKAAARISEAAHQVFERVARPCRAIRAALTNDKAMPASKRHLDETMIAVGTATTAAGIATLNPLEVAGGVLSVYEGLEDLEEAGEPLLKDGKSGESAAAPEAVPAPPPAHGQGEHARAHPRRHHHRHHG